MPKTIDGIVLSDFVSILLGNARYTDSCPPYIAKKLQECDIDEQYIFVEYANELNRFERPRVWNAKDWKDSLERLVKRRKLSDLENHVHTLASDCRNKALAHLCSLTGLDSSSLMDAAVRIVRGRNLHAMLNVGVKEQQVMDLIDADRELVEYKNKIGLK